MDKFIMGARFGFGLMGTLINLGEKNTGTAIAASIVCVVSLIGFFIVRNWDKSKRITKEKRF